MATAITDHEALVAAIGAIRPVQLGLYPTISDITAARMDCEAAINAVTEYVCRRLADVQLHTGTMTLADERSEWIADAFRENCRAGFEDAEQELIASAPAYRRVRAEAA